MRFELRAALTTVVLAAVGGPAFAQTFHGPLPYASTADSPFPLGSGAFFVEDFEDGVLDAPGVSPSNGYVASTQYSGTIIDSVDADDGVLGNGPCGTCDSFYGGSGFPLVRFLFDAGALGGLPTRAGLVWTDGGFGTTVTFEAFDALGTSLGTVVATNQGDGTNFGTTDEDRFYGVEFAGGISELRITNSSGGIEVDHLQYELPCPAANATVYCTSKTNSLGCQPKIGFEGCPSASSASSCRITGSAFLNKKNGLLFYGQQPLGAAFQGGFLCVKSPITRTNVQNSGGSPSGSDCTGTYQFDLNALVQSGSDPNLVVGATVRLQWWARDPNDPFTTSLSNGLSLTIGP
ncbi:MAG: hypothetical protein L6Q99_19060 [Planctomycetes bacterium]|nr:hypothetical protein [Planctomycetota bacterium]